MKNFVKMLQQQHGVFAKEVNCANIAYHSKYIASAGPALLRYLKEVSYCHVITNKCFVIIIITTTTTTTTSAPHPFLLFAPCSVLLNPAHSCHNFRVVLVCLLIFCLLLLLSFVQTRHAN
jgi:hypothetical protein